MAKPGKIGRNDPCWCGSGRKYKKCHINRDKLKKETVWEAEKRLKRAFGAEYCCCPDQQKTECSGNIVKAHTISKSSSLKKIARDGHVYAFVPSLIELHRSSGKPQPRLYGVNKASIFTGFCAHHDNALFEPLDNEEFDYGIEQVFLAGYRALMREYFNKKAHAELAKSMKTLDRGKSHQEQVFLHQFLEAQDIGLEAGLRGSLHHKQAFDSILVNEQFQPDVGGYVVEFTEVLPFQCSGAFYPEYDFSEQSVQSLLNLDETLDNLCVSVLASGGKSFVVLTWLRDSQRSAKAVIESMEKLEDAEVFSRLLHFCISFIENVFFEPSWWEGLDTSTQDRLADLYVSGAHPEIHTNRKYEYWPALGSFLPSQRKKLGCGTEF